MKKTIVAVLAAALLMTFGLVGFSTTSASASCGTSTYGGCARTDTEVRTPGRHRPHQRARLVATLRVIGASNTPPRGKFSLAVRGIAGPGNHFKYFKTARIGSLRHVFVTPRLKRGRYRVNLRFISNTQSPFRNSQDTTSFRVKKRR